MAYDRYDPAVADGADDRDDDRRPTKLGPRARRHANIRPSETRAAASSNEQRATRFAHGSATTDRSDRDRTRRGPRLPADRQGARFADPGCASDEDARAARTLALPRRRRSPAVHRPRERPQADDRLRRSRSPAAGRGFDRGSRRFGLGVGATRPSLRANGAAARSTSSIATMTIIAASISRSSKSDFAGWRDRRQSKRQMLRGHPRAYGGDRQRRRACRHRRPCRRRPHHPDQERPGSGRRPPFAQLHRRSTASKATG